MIYLTKLAIEVIVGYPRWMMIVDVIFTSLWVSMLVWLIWRGIKEWKKAVKEF
jgi:hypothetical protein